jgi:hypothetical protein
VSQFCGISVRIEAAIRRVIMRCAVSIAAFLTICAAGPLAAQQPPQQSQIPLPLPMRPAPPGPYKQIAVTLPPAVNDPAFAAFRKELGDIAQRKDRAALAGKLVAKGFFWQREDSNDADAKKPAIDNLAAAIGLDAPDGSGWQALASYAADGTAAPLPEMKGVICGPAVPNFDDRAMEDAAASTRSDPAEWGYPIRDGTELRAKPDANAPVVEKLGMFLVRTLIDEDQSAAGEWIKLVTPSGKIGYVRIDALAPISSDQLCYQKEGSNWKIAGYVGVGGGQE